MDLLMSLVAKDEASAIFGQFSGAVLGAGKALGSMMKAGAEAERVERQLKSVAGDLTETFKKQAAAMSEQLAVEDEMIMSMQTLQLRYGAAPASIDGTTRAVLDYAAATGKDATSATEALLRGVQQGTGSIKALGIQYKATGDFTKDMALATAALSKKFGGAAEVDADTLAGSARAASQQMGELQETFGMFLGDMVKSSGVLPAVTRMLKQLRDELSPNKDKWDSRGDLMKERDLIQGALAGGIDSSVPGSKTRSEVVARLEEINRLLKEIDSSPVAASVGLSAVSTGTVKAGGGKSKADEDLDFKLGMSKTQELFRQQEKAQDDFELEQQLKKKAAMDKHEQDVNDHIARIAKAEGDALVAQYAQQDKDYKEYIAASNKAREDFHRKNQEDFDKSASTWVNAGMDIGRAIIDGIAAAMEDGENGKGGTGDIIRAVYGIVETVMGIVFSAAGYGAVYQGFQGITKTATGLAESQVQSHHTGGWPKAKRFHTGDFAGEVPALLQEGERVLSRSEVARMGGRQGVESRVRGAGGGGNYTITAIDADSFKRYLEDKGGRAFFNALRTGRGSLAGAFGRI